MDRRTDEGSINRRSLLLRGGAVAVGTVGATVAGAAVASPASAAGFGYTPITPYRSYDSRNDVAGKINDGEFFGVQVITDEGGTFVVPTTAQAVTFNLTITQTVGRGFLGVAPGDALPASFTVSTINWTTPNLDLANGGTTKLGVDPGTGVGSVEVYCGGTADAATHVIIDITGYFS